MQEAQRIQQADVSGKQFVFGATEQREMQQLDRTSNQIAALIDKAKEENSEKIENSKLEELVITNTIPQLKQSSKIRVLDVAGLFASVMQKVNSNESISGHFVM